MYTLMTVLRKKPEVSTEDFRHFLEHEYGPAYVAMPQVRHYVQRYVTDLATDPADPMDAFVEISFDSPEAMREALDTDGYRQAHERRQAYMADIRSAVVDREVKLV
ncbi:EthD family reductase [Actinoplanes sp. TBRC 11911]|uniref:EthD family reductase n=1 Tax=Actinoplanes sp. TBRC 11911 TaxID=2729386 RepID=UPI00145CC8FA|nr:EthD family reductase [Actinoplanes sp. TBRC 11911]NMO50741.1 EthD family reductase [Actinoplanes sp. TBRC 11911]